MSKCYLVLVGRQVQVHATGARGRGQLRDQVGGHLSSGKNSSLSFSTSVVESSAVRVKVAVGLFPVTSVL